MAMVKSQAIAKSTMKGRSHSISFCPAPEKRKGRRGEVEEEERGKINGKMLGLFSVQKIQFTKKKKLIQCLCLLS